MPRCVARFLLPLLLLLTVMEPREAHAISDFDLDWYTIETPHFLIHYHSGLEDMARDTARYAEEAHTLLAPLIDWVPGAKTHIVLTDTGDSANGSARIIPFNLIRLLGATPDVRSTLNDYDNWLRGLLYHEYVHILQIDIVYGLPALFNVFFGKQLAPNQVLPRWFTEGLATYYESSRTGSGRVRSSIFRMMLRTDALQNRLLGLDDISAAPVRWPGVRAWYLYGSHFLTWVVARHGEAALNDFSHAYADRLVPFGLNVVARSVWNGEDWRTLYDSWQTALTAESIATSVIARAQGPIPDIPTLTSLGIGSDHLRRRPGTPQLTYLRNNGERTKAYMSYDIESGEHRRIMESFDDGRHAWSPDGRWMALSRPNLVKRFYYFHDLYLYNAEADTLEQLTSGLRAREPSFSHDGHKLVAVTWRHGSSSLIELDLETRQITTLYEGQSYEMLSTPMYLRGDRQVVVSRFVGDPVGRRDLYILDLETGAWTALTQDDAQDIEPSVTPDGRSIVFASDRSGIYDIYRIDVVTGTITRLTRTLTGLFSPQVDDSGALLATVYNARGQDVALIPADQLLNEPAGTSYERPRIDYAEPALELTPRSYRPWRYLWPRTWFPDFTFADGAAFVGLSVGGSDPVGNHSWLASLTWDAIEDSLSYFVTYSYRRLPVDLTFSHSRRVATRNMIAESRPFPYREEQVNASISAYIPFPNIPGGHAINVGFTVSRSALAEPLQIHHDPLDNAVRLPELGFFNSLQLSWSFSDVESYFYSISPELGFRLGLGLRWVSPLLGADYDALDVTYSAGAYVPNPWLAGHVLALQIRGGVTFGNYGRRGIWVLGGVPEQDIVSALIDGFGVSGSLLRGYLPGSFFGTQFHLFNAEYRLPIWDVETGWDTLPFYMGRLFGAVFVDYGGAFFGDFDMEELAVGIGAELRLTTLLGYGIPATLRLGYAHGFDPLRGVDHIYLVIGNSF